MSISAMQNASSKIWTQFTLSIFNEENYYTSATLIQIYTYILLHQKPYNYVYAG